MDLNEAAEMIKCASQLAKLSQAENSNVIDVSRHAKFIVKYKLPWPNELIPDLAKNLFTKIKDVNEITYFFIHYATRHQKKYWILLMKKLNPNYTIDIEPTNKPNAIETIIHTWHEIELVKKLFETQVDKHSIDLLSVISYVFEKTPRLLTDITENLLKKRFAHILPPYHFKYLIEKYPECASRLFLAAAHGNCINQMNDIFFIHQCLKIARLPHCIPPLNTYTICPQNGVPPIIYAILYCNYNMMLIVLRAQPPCKLFSLETWQKKMRRLIYSGRLYMVQQFKTLCETFIRQGIYTQEDCSNVLPLPDTQITADIIFNACRLGHIPSIIQTIKEYAYSIKRRVHLCPVIKKIKIQAMVASIFRDTLFTVLKREAPISLRSSRIGFLKGLAKYTPISLNLDALYQEKFGDKTLAAYFDIMSDFMLYFTYKLNTWPLFDIKVIRVIRSFIIADDLSLVFENADDYIYPCSNPSCEIKKKRAIVSEHHTSKKHHSAQKDTSKKTSFNIK